MSGMTEQDRHRWMHRSGNVHATLSHAATHGGYACDDCGAPSQTISHSGEGSAVRVLCAPCWRKDWDRQRAERAPGAAARFNQRLLAALEKHGETERAASLRSRMDAGEAAQ
jgi:hypothetical protein